MARYIPKHRRRPTLAERRRSFGVLALGISSVVGLSGTYGFVPGVQAAAPEAGAGVSGPVRTAAATSASTGVADAFSAGGITTSASSTAAAVTATPKFVGIDAIGLTSSLLPLGLRDDGTLEVPEVASQAGWFSGGVRPGDPGPAVIVGHVDSYLGSAVFSRLHELTPGDRIEVVRGDGSSLMFAVDRIDQYPKAFFPTDLVYGGSSKPELRLITCGGTFNRSARSYEDNLVVYASLVA